MENIFSLVGDRIVIDYLVQQDLPCVAEMDEPRTTAQNGPLNCPAGTPEILWSAPTLIKLVVEVGPPFLALCTALVPLLQAYLKNSDGKNEASVVVNVTDSAGTTIAISPSTNVEDLNLSLG